VYNLSQTKIEINKNMGKGFLQNQNKGKYATSLDKDGDIN
jgi:hypothetical protein